MEKIYTQKWIRGKVTQIVPSTVYLDKIYDLEIYIQTESGQELDLFDIGPLISTGLQIGKSYDFLISLQYPSLFLNKPQSAESCEVVVDSLSFKIEEKNAIQRKPLSKEMIPQKPLPFKIPNLEWCSVLSKDGIFLVLKRLIEELFQRPIQQGDHFFFKDGRMDLVAWRNK